MYRKEIKVMDCTVRDGGLMNKWQFSDEFVGAVYKACLEAGIDYMEIGYKSSESAFSRDQVGPWKFCDEADLRRVVGKNATSLEIISHGRHWQDRSGRHSSGQRFSTGYDQGGLLCTPGG